MEGAVDHSYFNSDLASPPPWTILRPVEALTNLVFLLRTAPHSQDTELYLDLAEKELDRLKNTIQQQFAQISN